MTLTRRDMIRMSASAGVALATPVGDAFSQIGGAVKRAIPSTGEPITAIGLGTNRYGVGSSAEARAPLRAALARFHALGGQLIDTAEEYGSSEIVVGELTEALDISETVFLATKVRMVGREAGVRSIEQSFARLNRQRLDLVQVHDLVDYATQIETLRALKAEGRVRYIGMTTAGDEHPTEMERLMRSENVDFVQLSYSLEDRSAAERLLPLAADRGMAVLVNRPLGRGNIFRAIGQRPLPDWASELDCTSWAQFFLKYIISHPAVTCAIPGMRRESHVVDNMGAAYGRLPDAELRARQERYFDALA